MLQAGQAKIFRCSRMYIENVSAFNVSGSRQPLYKNFAKQQMINIKYVLYLIAPPKFWVQAADLQLKTANSARLLDIKTGVRA